ncbi:hypothetical protein TrLO_g6427 [Triparma laevis f. longispina]|uniref:C2 domain-containing protein n=1 Tax=Triparma laevis f. longispina TaxID=1714387 RepID=A0A9W7DXK3_9STRA|nr:hypothetical protein TrLO_g6427 [Triparma laevis f. longispina]
MSSPSRKLRATEGKPVSIDADFQNVMKDLAGIEGSPKSPKSPKLDSSADPTQLLAAKKAARKLRGFRTTFGSKKGDDTPEMTDTERALLEAKLEAEREEKRKEEEERLQKEAEEKDQQERKQVKESLDKWKVKKTDTCLNLAEILGTPYFEILHNTKEGVKVLENLPEDWGSIYEDVLLPAVVETGPRLLKVKIVEGKDLIACDSSGVSDPYIKLSLQDVKTQKLENFKSKTIKKTVNPVFNEVFVLGKNVDLLEIENQPILKLMVYDSDTFSSEEMGKIEIDLKEINQETSLTRKWFTIEKSEKMKKNVSGSILLEFQYSRCGKKPATNRSARNSKGSRIFKRSVGKLRTSFNLRGTSPIPKKNEEKNGTITPKRSTSPFRRSLGKNKSWMKAKSAFSLISGTSTSDPTTDSKNSDVDIDLLASNLAAQVERGEEIMEKKKAKQGNGEIEEIKEPSEPEDVNELSKLLNVKESKSLQINVPDGTTSSNSLSPITTKKSTPTTPSSSRKNIFGVASFGKKAFSKMRSLKNDEKIKAEKSEVEGGVDEEKKSEQKDDEFEGIEQQESSVPQLSDTREAGLVDAFAANLGMTGEVESIIKEGKKQKEADEPTSKGVLRHSKSAHNRRAIMEDEEESKNECLSLTLLDNMPMAAAGDGTPLKSALKNNNNTTPPKSALKKSALKASRFSGAGTSNLSTSETEVMVGKGRSRGGASFDSQSRGSKIKFSSSSISRSALSFAQDDDDDVNGEEADKEAEKLAAELAAMVSDGVNIGDEDSLEGAGTTTPTGTPSRKERKSGFASLAGLKSAGRSFKRSVGNLSPKNAGQSPKRKGGLKTWSAAKTKLKGVGSFQAAKSPLLASHNRNNRKTAGVIGLAGSDKTETIDDLIAESVEPEKVVEPEPDKIANQTKPLCPTIVELNGLPVKLLLGGKLTRLNLESQKLGNVEAHLLSELLKGCSALTSLNLCANKFKAQAMAVLAPTVEGLTELKHLDLSRNLLFKKGGMLVPKILAKCENLESLILKSCELTNSKEISLNERKVKEDKDDIIPDQLAAMMLRDEMGKHKKLIHLDVEENEIDEFIMLGVKNRLKVNKALLHGRPDFEAFVDDKFNLKGSKLEREKLEHTTNISVDHGYFDRERVERVAYAVVEGEGTVKRREREAKEERERILILEEEERKKQEERMKQQRELEELGMAVAPGEEVGERRGSVGGMAGSLAAAKMLKKVQTHSSLYGKKKKKKGKELWDDTPHVYYLNRVPFREEVKSGTPHSRHAFRKNFVYPPPDRCGNCIGCSALLRCENQGAYVRTAETVDLIKTGLLDGEMDLKEALEVVRNKAGEKRREKAKRYTRRASDLKKDSSIRRNHSSARNLGL